MKNMKIGVILGLVAAAILSATWIRVGDVQKATIIDDDRITQASASVADLENRITGVEGRSIALGAAGTEVPTIVALFSTSLAAQISSTATSMTLVSGTDKAGTTLASSTYPFIIDEGTASEEMVIADCTSTACTNMIRGINPVSGTTTVSALKKSHRRGASVKITDGPQLMILSRLANGIGFYPNILAYSTAVASSSFNADGQIPNKAYVDYVGSSGCANASTVTRGCIEFATAAETAAGTGAGGTGATLGIPASLATSTPTAAGCPTFCVVVATAGKIPQAFFDLTSQFTFTGGLLITASSTINATTTIAASSLTNKALCLNAVCYQAPSAQGAASTFLQNDGTGIWSWAASPLNVLYNADFPGNTSSTGTTTIKTVSIPANTVNATNKRFRVTYVIIGVNQQCYGQVDYGTGAATTTVGYASASNGGIPAKVLIDEFATSTTNQGWTANTSEVAYGAQITYAISSVTTTNLSYIDFRLRSSGGSQCNVLGATVEVLTQ